MPNIPTTQALVKVIGYDSAGNAVQDLSNSVFTISNPTVTVVSPNGGENWRVNSSHQITWSETNLSASSYSIQYSVDGGTTWTNITSVSGSTTSYPWTVPNIPTTQALVKVIGYDSAGNAVQDLSNSVFTISNPTVTVVSPNGGENWLVNFSHQITWSETNLSASSYSIQYSVDGGSTWTNITSVSGSTTSYPWTVPNTPTNTALVKVIGYDSAGNAVPDQSNSVFTISNPVITVVSPNGGENWLVNSSHQITWSETNLSASSYTIQYSVDGGSTWTNITSVSGSTTSYPWTVPNTPTTTALVKVIGYDSVGNAVPDQSNSVFTISNPVITVVSPNGGENWLVNSSHQITWSETNLSASSYTIQYSVDGGSTWTNITSVSGSTTSYPWTVPNTPTNTALVKVIGYDSAGNAVPDQSNSVFTISNPTVTVISPNGGENWLVNSSHQITWSETNLSASSYTIQYSVDGGSTWTNITSVSGSTTSYPWTVPNTPTNTALVKVIGYDSAGNAVPDQSNSVFTISNPVVTVVSPNGGENWLVNSSHQITWSETNLSASSYTIQYSVDGGSTWTNITSVSGSTTSYPWTVPNTPTNTALVKVIGYDSAGNAVPDRSNSVFTISNPVVTVVSPNGGENWLVNSSHPITWSETNLSASSYSIQYSVDGGTTWTNITSVSGSTTSYPWTVPNTPTITALVKVIGYDSAGNAVPDQSNSVFTISNPVVTVVSPNGGENWLVNSSHQITWSETNLSASSYSIQYSVDGGTTWTNITSVSGSTTSYPWTVPNTPTITALVKVIGYDSAGNAVPDQSNSVFTISNPVVTVVSPNGGENWLVNSSHQITWSETNLSASSYSIQYSIDGGTTWTNITSVSGSTTSYPWAVPNTPTTQALVKIIGYDSAGNAVPDQSNSVFTISNPVVTVVSPNGGENWLVNSTHPITWSATNLSATSYTLQYSIDGGTTWTNITSVSGSTTSYPWAVPNTPTTQALVKIIGYDSAGNAVPDQSNSMFTISNPVVTVLSPNGGENWLVNSSHQITWSETNLSASSYSIQYSIDGGTTWTNITSVSGSTTSYPWAVPNTPTTQALVKVIGYDSAGNAVPDQSNSVFTISNPVVTVVSPNGGENWLVNSSHPITWTKTNLTATSYTLQYSIDAGVTWINISTSVPGGDTSYNWTVPNSPTTQALVKVIGYDSVGNTVPDQSNSVFTISNPAVTVVSPNGGENWLVNSNHPITWTKTNLTATSYTIQYSIDAGATWINISTSVSGGDTSYNWTVPNSPTTQALVKVIGYDSAGNAVPDQSNSVFTISNPVVTVVSPNGGENWLVNSSHPITWTKTNLTATSYTLQYSIDAGATWINISTSVPGGDTSYNWTVPNSPTTQALVKVIGYDSTGNAVPDQSNFVFTISNPVVTVVSPNGGENWLVNSSHPITWTKTNLTTTSYTLQYSINNGTTWTNISTSVPGGDTSYNWTVPNSPTTQALVKVIGYDSAGNAVPDQSNSVFTISNPVVTVVSPNGGENWLVNSSHQITWTKTNLTATSYTLQYSINNGTSWTNISTSVPGGDTSYNWTVPNTPTAQALVKVIGYDSAGNAIPDQSNSVFTISNPIVTVTSPNGGENWLVNVSHNITWTTSNLTATSYTLQYSINNGTSWTNISTSVPGTNTVYNWTVPNTTTTQALVKIIGYDSSGNVISDQSDSVFTIYRPPVCSGAVGGQMYVLDTSTTVYAQYIGSSASYNQSVYLYYPGSVFVANKVFTNPGKVVSLGAYTTGAELIFRDVVYDTGYTYYTGPKYRNPDGIFHTKTTQVNESTYRVGFEDTYNSGDQDYNDIEFYVMGNITLVCPAGDASISVTSPNGGECWKPSTVHTITWSDSNFDAASYTIQYSSNSGGSWLNVTTGLSGSSNSYNWTTPSTSTSDGRIKVIGYDDGGFPISDYSANDFGIHSYCASSTSISSSLETTSESTATTSEFSSAETSGWSAPDCGEQFGSLYGRVVVKKFNDLNENGLQDSGEPIISGWSFTTLYEPPSGNGDNINYTSVTDKYGYYCTPCIRDGRNYAIIEADKAGWLHTTPNSITGSMSAGDPSTYVYVSFGNKEG